MEFILPLSLILPGLWVLQLARIKVQSNVERLSLSYLLSLTIMFTLLYLGGILKAFNFASFLFLAIVVVSFIHMSVSFLIKVMRSPRLSKTQIVLHISVEKLVVVISIIGLLSIYAVFLYSRAILDSDVVHDYLPMAREIVSGDGFTYSTGYDYNIPLKSIGASVIYAWAYVVIGSLLSEAFRLMPLIPILILILLNYAIASSATKSETIGIISTAVFLILPFHDRFLLNSAFYPDIFYYPLIFAAIYSLLEYFQSKQSSLLLWTGTGLGLAGLLKAQTIYVFIAFTLVLLVLELKDLKKLSTALCCLTPFYILIPSILASSIQSEGFRLSIPNFNGTQLVLFFFLSVLSGVCFYVTMYGKTSRTKIDRSMIKGLVRKIGLLIVPFAVLSSLWYMNNFFRFGTLIWTSSINLPNYDWALGVLEPLDTAQQTADLWHYLVYFVFIFVDPAVMGYAMLIPLLIGLLFVLRERLENFNILLFIGIISASVILSTVVFYLPSAIRGYNPRDIFILAPLIMTLSAVGIVSITSNFCKAGDNVKKVFMSFLLVTYFGLMNYIHSVYVLYTNSCYVTTIGELMSAFGNSVGLNLIQTSFQLSYGDSAIFVGENILKIVSLSLVAGFPVLVLMICRHYKLFPRGYKLFPRGYTIIVKIGTRPKKVVLKLPFRLCSSKQWVFMKSVFVISLMLSIIIIPRVEMLIVQGGPQEIKENQLKRNYGNIYELFASPSEFEGDILTFKAPMGLSYYLSGVKIIDLAVPANLAFLKDCFQLIAPYESVVKLKEQNIRYLFINPSVARQLDASLNFTLSKIIRNPELATLSRTFGSWQLYSLDSYNVEKTSISLSGWDIDPWCSNASYTFNSDETHLFLQLHPTDSNSRLTIVNRNLSKLNLSNYDYVVVTLEGISNTRIMIRFV